MFRMMKKITVYFGILLLLLAAMPAAAGDTIVIRKALAVKTSSYYRQGFFDVDAVERMLDLGSWTPPHAGQQVMNAGGAASWTVIEADEKGWFRGETLRGGWVYVRLDLHRAQTLLLEGMGHQLVYVNGQPRAGNRYQAKEHFAAWEPRWDFSQLPVRLHKGRNDLLFRCNRGRLKVRLFPSAKAIFLNPRDVTLPDVVQGIPLDAPAAILLVNTTAKRLENLFLTATPSDGEAVTQPLPAIPPYTVRKVPFTIRTFTNEEKGTVAVHLLLAASDKKVKKILDEKDIELRVVTQDRPRKITFVSDIDGSVQYYALTPALAGVPDEPKALVLSVHGASVEAISQAASYEPKPWVNIVCPTNRRPYGYDWEDWGRLDALEVLQQAGNSLPVDESRIYLTGHSMGGHGTWILGAQYPDHFGAIGPSAGWISWWSYVRKKKAPSNPVEKMLERATNALRPLQLLHNYSQEGIYVIHGDADDNVPVEQARLMVDTLRTFHHDLVYHEEPGAGHWWDRSDEPGADCVDWPPLFDFFARHARPGKERVRIVDFTTVNPGISSQDNWVEVLQQEVPLQVSRIQVQYDPGLMRFTGTTQNIRRLALEVVVPSPLLVCKVYLDGDTLEMLPEKDGRLYLTREEGHWQPAIPPPTEKNPARYGTFKDAIRHHVLFIVGTHGTTAENAWAAAKARYDAETFWYQGNGAVDIIADDDYDAGRYAGRGVVLYGNRTTNSAWNKLLGDSPLVVEKGKISLGNRTWTGNDLAAFFVRPRHDNDSAAVAVVAGTGLNGMRLTNLRPYLYAGNALPDLVIFSSRITTDGSRGVLAAGYWGYDWSLEKGDIAYQETKH